MRNVCNDCKRDFDDRERGTWHGVTGYVVEREGGGANAVREKRYTGDVICPECAKLRSIGVNRDQGKLI